MEVSKGRLIELQRKEKKLQALENGGVDDWKWDEEALKEYQSYIEREYKVIDLTTRISEVICEHGEHPAGYGISDEGQDEIEKIVRNELL